MLTLVGYLGNSQHSKLRTNKKFFPTVVWKAKRNCSTPGVGTAIWHLPSMPSEVVLSLKEAK